MVKTKKLQKNLGKGLLAGALEKPEVPDTIKFKKHFKETRQRCSFRCHGYGYVCNSFCK